MAKSRKPSSSDLPGKVAEVLARAVVPGSHLALGLSGGIDSVSLLSILRHLAPLRQFSLSAVHVDHGISPNSAKWADFCAGLCAGLKVPFRRETVDIEPYRSFGLEGAARRARYDVFARIDADFLVLAQHRDDQAETLLLQLLRGSGLRGLSGMSRARAIPGARASLLRPLLEIPREEIEEYALANSLAWIEDESNLDVARRRNFLRHKIVPLLETQFAGARATIARTATHLAEAGELLEEMARADLERAGGGPVIELSLLRELGEARAKNLLRHLCDVRGIPPFSTARLDELLRQLLLAREDAAVRMAASGWEFRRYRGGLYLDREQASNAGLRESWSGENALPLLELGGILRLKPEEGRGLSLQKLRDAPVTVRLRRGGETLRTDPRRPRRTLKNFFQEQGIPPWRRDRLPLLYCGDQLVSVPGIGDACEFRASPGEAGLIVTWESLA
jgi:tRNA(Ile)-lysidine synthase